MIINPAKSTLFTWDLSLPLNRRRRLWRYVVDNTGGARHFCGYALDYAGEHIVGQLGYGGCGGVCLVDGAQGYYVAVGAGTGLHSYSFCVGDYGEVLPDFGG